MEPESFKKHSLSSMRDFQRKGRSLADAALGQDSTAMSFGDFLADDEPQTRAGASIENCSPCCLDGRRFPETDNWQ